MNLILNGLPSHQLYQADVIVGRFFEFCYLYQAHVVLQVNSRYRLIDNDHGEPLCCDDFLDEFY